MYKTIVKIALASLVRRPTRSALLVLMIAISLWGMLLMEGIYDGITEQMIDNAIRSDSGHISIFGKGYRLDPDYTRWIDNYHEVSAILAATPAIKSYAKRLTQEGMVATAHYSRGAQIVGITLEDEKQPGRLADYLLLGEFNFGKKERGAIIGYKFAERLQVKIGGKIILSTQDSLGAVSAAPFRVTGVLRTNNMALDENGVFIGNKQMRKLVSVEHKVSQITIILHDEQEAVKLQQKLNDVFSELDILRWDEMYPALLQSRVIMEGFNMGINVLIFCVAALGIFGVTLVSVLERLREFGVMIAIGTRFSEIRNIILTESFVLGIFGYSVGAMAGWITLIYLNRYGLDLSAFGESFEVFGMDPVTYALIRPSYFVTALVAVVIANILSVIIPLRILNRTKPIDTINTI